MEYDTWRQLAHFRCPHQEHLMSGIGQKYVFWTMNGQLSARWSSPAHPGVVGRFTQRICQEGW